MKRFYVVTRTLNKIENALVQFFEYLSNLHLFGLIVRRFNSLVRYVSNDETLVSPTPRELMKAIETAAKRHAVEWQVDDWDYPNHYSVAVNNSAWELYYGMNAGYIAGSIADELKVRLSLETGPKWNPVVEIIPDGYTDKYKITTSFVSATMPVEKVQSVKDSLNQTMGVADVTEVDEDVATLETSSAPSPESNKTAIMNAERTALILEGDSLAADDAAVLVVGNQKYTLENNSDFGFARQQRTPPVIRVNKFVQNGSYVSTHQGVFNLNDQGVWTLKNLGGNALYVKHANEGERIRLKTGETIEVFDDSRIYLPESAQYLTFKTDAEAKKNAVSGTALQIQVAG